MISSKLVELIEIHAERLTGEVAQDLATNARTRGFHALSRAELSARIFELYHNLGNWIGAPKDDAVQAEFEEWGHRRFSQGIPLSEIMYAVILLKRHLTRYIHDHGLIESSFPRIESDYVLPMHLHSLQELNNLLGEFFDRALYYLACGYEAEAKRAASGSKRP